MDEKNLRRLGDLSLVLTEHPGAAEQERIKGQIKAFNDSVSAHHRQVRQTGPAALAVYLRTAKGDLAGGVLASLRWGWLCVDEVWVTEGLRGQGYGRAMMRAIEEEALHRGCRWAQVKTWDFQARGFYERLGYEVVGTMDDYPPGSVLYWLRKTLTVP